MEQSKDNTNERHCLGMISQLSKISPDLASKTKLLYELLSTKNWTKSTKAFADTKTELSSPKIFALYNTCAIIIVSADASSFRLGGVLSHE